MGGTPEQSKNVDISNDMFGTVHDVFYHAQN